MFAQRKEIEDMILEWKKVWNTVCSASARFEHRSRGTRRRRRPAITDCAQYSMLLQSDQSTNGSLFSTHLAVGTQILLGTGVPPASSYHSTISLRF